MRHCSPSRWHTPHLPIRNTQTRPTAQAGFQHGWTAAQCWDAYQELYGPEYVYFKAAAAPAPHPHKPGAPPPAPVRTLSAVLAAHPEKRRPILLAMFQTLSKQTDKGLLSLPVAQRLLLEYLQHAPPEQVGGPGATSTLPLAPPPHLHPSGSISDPCSERPCMPPPVCSRCLCTRTLCPPCVCAQVVYMVSAVRGHILAMLASRDGARAAALCFAYAAPKERKFMLRLLKGHMPDIACHDHGHMVRARSGRGALSGLRLTGCTLSAVIRLARTCRSSSPPSRTLTTPARRGRSSLTSCGRTSPTSPATTMAARCASALPSQAALADPRPPRPGTHTHMRFLYQVLLALLAPRDPRYFAPTDLEMLEPTTVPAYIAARKVETPAAPGDKDEAAAAPPAKGTKAGAAAAVADTEDKKDVSAAAVAADAGLGPRKHLLPLEPTPEQQRDTALMAPVPTSKKPESIKTRELLAALRSDLEGVLLSRTSLLARSPEAAAVLQVCAILSKAPHPAHVGTQRPHLCVM